jgi:hypothetical protein
MESGRSLTSDPGSQLLEDVLRAIRDAKLLPVKIEAPPERWIQEGVFISGELHAFLEAVVTVQARAVLWYSRQLYGEDFVRKDEQGQVIDLATVEPSLARFRERLGSIGAVHLAALHEGAVLRYTSTETWFEQFIEHSMTAEATISSETSDEADAVREHRARLLT